MTYITSIERLAMERGHQKGRLEGQRKTQLAIAKQLLAKGQDAGFVIEITGLTLTDIETLQAETNHQ